MVQFFKYFWLALLVSVLSFSSTSTEVPTDFPKHKVKNSKKRVKLSKKTSPRKGRKKKKVSNLKQKENLPASLSEKKVVSPEKSRVLSSEESDLIDDVSSSFSEMGQQIPNADNSLPEEETARKEGISFSSEEIPLINGGTLSETKEEPDNRSGSILNEDVVSPVTEQTPEEALQSTSSPADEESSLPAKEVLTLKEALEGAYAQSPLLTAEYQVKVAQMALSGAKREWLPKTGATVGYSRTTGDYVSSRGLSSATGSRYDSQHNINNESTQGGLSLQQNLYSGGSTTANILSQEKSLDAALAGYTIALRDTFLSAIQSFIQLCTKQEMFRVTKANQSFLERQLDITQNRYEFGELTRYDVAATQAKLDKAKAEVINALAEVEIAKANFIKVTGITAVKGLKKPEEPFSLIPASKEEAIQLALKLSPEIHTKEAAAEAAKAETDKVFGGLLPSLDISANATRTLTDHFDSSSYYMSHGKTRREQLEAGATLSIPLDFRGTTQTNIRQQKYVAAQKRLGAIYERRNVIELASKYWDSLEAARARITQLKSQVKAGEIAMETVTEGFLAGNNTTLDVLSVEQDLFSAQVDLVNAEQSVILNAYQLIATIGRLDVESLNLNVGSYNPKEEYNNLSFWGINIPSDERINAQDLSTSLIQNAEANT